MDSYETMNDVLVRLFNDIWEIEERAIITEEFKDITANDMHIIEAVGIGQRSNMSSIAKRLSVTVGSLTTSMNSLVKKGYVIRERCDDDRRVVYIRLTEKGEKAYKHHEEFHKKMIQAVLGNLSEEETGVLSKALNDLTVFFRNYH